MEVSMRVRWCYLALLLTGCLWGNPAMATDGPTKLCRASATNLILQVIRATPDVQVYEFRGLDAEIGIALYNSLPPVGHLHGDRFYILVKPGAPISHLMIGNADCLQDTATVDRATAGIIKKAIERAAAASSI
jgi:hypothetical protein